MGRKPGIDLSQNQAQGGEAINHSGGPKEKKRNHIKAGVLISSEIYKNDSLWVKMDLNMYCLKSCRTKTNAVKRLLSTS